MKKLKIVLWLGLAMVFLAACAGVPLNNWPGLAATEDMVVLAYGQVHVVDARTGVEKWKYPEKIDNASLIFSNPVVVDNKIIVASYANVVQALDAQSGAVLWTFDTFKGKGKFVAGPVVAGDTILVPSTDHHLYALDLNGKLLWRFQSRNALWAPVVADEEHVYLAGLDHYLYAIRLSNGQMDWEVDLGGPLIHAPGSDGNGRLYMTTLKREALAIDKQDGRILWRTPLTGSSWAAPLVAEGKVVFGTDQKKAYILNAENGQALASLDVAAGIIGGPALFEGVPVLVTEGGEVFQFKWDGTRGWTRTIEGQLGTTPVISDGRLVVSGLQMKNLIVTFRPDGTEDWSLAASK